MTGQEGVGNGREEREAAPENYSVIPGRGSEGECGHTRGGQKAVGTLKSGNVLERDLDICLGGEQTGPSRAPSPRAGMEPGSLLAHPGVQPPLVVALVC